MTIRLLLADDQPLVRAGLRMLLDAQDDLEVVGEAGNGEEAIEVAATTRPDIVLMDVRMPEMDGVAATKALLDSSSQSDRLRVIVLTTYHVDEAVYAAIRAGASGFLLKDASPEELVRAVRAVAVGDGWLDPQVVRRLMLDFAATPEVGTPPPEALQHLTAREIDVLTLIGHGKSNEEIAQHFTLAMPTVKTHVSRILSKLQLQNRSQAVAAAYQCGLIRAGDRPPPRSS